MKGSVKVRHQSPISGLSTSPTTSISVFFFWLRSLGSAIYPCLRSTMPGECGTGYPSWLLSVHIMHRALIAGWGTHFAGQNYWKTKENLFRRKVCQCHYPKKPYTNILFAKEYITK